MKPSTPPKVVALEVVATQPTEADTKAIAHLSAQAGKSLPQVAYLVKVRLKKVPPATSHGWALYVNDFRIPKYWEYEHGIYFKVFDPQFFADHQGEQLRFSDNGTEFVDTGVKLTAPDSGAGKHTKRATYLPLQSEFLK
jgi:hypothetical protein